MKWKMSLLYYPYCDNEAENAKFFSLVLPPLFESIKKHECEGNRYSLVWDDKPISLAIIFCLSPCVFWLLSVLHFTIFSVRSALLDLYTASLRRLLNFSCFVVYSVPRVVARPVTCLYLFVAC
eukprot:g48788.t1